MYRALEFFTDTQDNDYRYYPGDRFPREGKEVNASRISALSGNSNLRGRPVIIAEKDDFPMPEPVEEEIPEVKKETPKQPARKKGRRRAD